MSTARRAGSSNPGGDTTEPPEADVAASAPVPEPIPAAPAADAPILVLDKLETYFAIRQVMFRPRVFLRAVDGVSLKVGKGETLAIVGESGCGKTTLGRTSVRLIEPTGGRVFFDGREITHTKQRDLMWLRRKTQIVPQDPYASVNPSFTVFKILEEPLIVHRLGTAAERATRIHEALESVKLTPADSFAPKYPHMLSGGQRQRVAMARSMILEPELIIADEPVSMLDASVRISILELMRQIQQERRVAFLYITHDLATAKHFSDRIGIMYAGKLVELGPVKAVLSEPLHPYTQGLMAAIPDPDPQNRFRTLAALPGEPPHLTDPPPGCRFHPRCPIAREGLCDVEEPLLRELRPGHFAACHLAV